MRIPYDKVYRAFPELDQFSDDQCNRFVERCRASGDSTAASPFVALAVLLCCGGCCVGQLVMMPILRDLDANRIVSRSFLLIAGLCMFFWLLLPTVAGLVARDWVLHRNLRRIIWRNIERIRCLECRYLLLGQRVVGGVVHCPECGRTTTLEALGLESEQDLIPPRTIEDELTPEARA